MNILWLTDLSLPVKISSELMSWSVLGHVLSEEQSKDGSNRASDDGRLTIVQCHHYHWPPSLDLYWSSVGILPPLRYHQHNLHSYHCHYQPAPCAFYRSTTTAPPCSTHVPCSRPITSCTHQSQGHELWSPQGPARIYVGVTISSSHAWLTCFFITFTFRITCYQRMSFYFHSPSCITRILHASDACHSISILLHALRAFYMLATHVSLTHLFPF